MAQPKIKDNAITDNITAGNIGGFVVGTSANNILQLNASAQLPAVDGSLITNVDAVTLTGQIIGTSANNIVALNASSQLPAVDGSLITNLQTTTMLDTPIQLFNGSTPPTVATPLTHANLTGKSQAILRCRAVALLAAAEAANSTSEVLGRIASTSSITSDHECVAASITQDTTSNSVNKWAYDTNDIIVNLDGSSQFWYNVLKVVPASSSVWFEIVLVGWID